MYTELHKYVYIVVYANIFLYDIFVNGKRKKKLYVSTNSYTTF